MNVLVGAIQLLGVPRGVDTGVIKNLVFRFVDEARGLEGWIKKDAEGRIQSAVDLGFLGLLKGMEISQDEMTQRCLPSVSCPRYTMMVLICAQAEQIQIPAGVPDDFVSRLPTILADHLRRSQLLLNPLIAHLPSTILPAAQPVPSSRSTASSFLKFGPPPTGEFISPVAVAKPGKRFGLLSIAV